MNYGMIAGAGLLAGATTCAVTQGGLLVGLITRQRTSREAGTTPRPSAADDLTPVASFLLGKLLSHTAAGFLLGAIGGALDFNPRVGAAAQLVAGLVIITLGLGALGVPGFRDLQFTPPESWLGVVRKRTRSAAPTAPFLLGMAVLVVPCGVTISMEVLAASSSSAVTGAAIMAVFVIGTAPMFTLYGYLSQRLRFHSVMSPALAVVVVAVGAITLNAGLVAAGSPYSAQALRERMSTSVTAANPVGSTGASPVVSSAALPGQRQVIAVEATDGGYQPREIAAKAGSPITLTFTTHSVQSCIRATTMPTLGKQLILPEDGSGSLELGVLSAGNYAITCSMGMYTATLHVTS